MTFDWRFLYRFTLLHFLTYIVFGILFMVITGYFTFFQEHEVLKDIMLPSTALSVRLAPLVQILRGFILGLAFYPFRSVLRSERGWLKLFFLLFVFSSIGSVITGPGSIEGLLYTNIGIVNPLIGLPEVIFQILAFSFLLWKWEMKKPNRLQELI